jgi:hypothetical protein
MPAELSIVRSLSPDAFVADAVPVARQHASTLSVAGETVIYDEQEHAMLVLNSSAGEVWARCEGSRTVDDIVAELAAAHGTDCSSIEDDVWQTVCKLASLGLLAVRRATPSGPTR